ncbi:unnamed protein product [Urochloa humidicola]
MATVSDGTAATTVIFKNFPPFVYLVACSNQHHGTAILDMLVEAVYLLCGQGCGDDDEVPVLIGVMLVVNRTAGAPLLVDEWGVQGNHSVRRVQVVYASTVLRSCKY